MINKSKLSRKDAMDLSYLESVACDHGRDRIHVGQPLYSKLVETMDGACQKLYREQIRHQFTDKKGHYRAVTFIPVAGK